MFFLLKTHGELKYSPTMLHHVFRNLQILQGKSISLDKVRAFLQTRCEQQKIKQKSIPGLFESPTKTPETSNSP